MNDFEVLTAIVKVVQMWDVDEVLSSKDAMERIRDLVKFYLPPQKEET